MLCGPQRMAWEGLLGGAEPGIWCYGGNLPDGHEEEKGRVSTAESAQCAPLSLKPVLLRRGIVVSLITPVSLALDSARDVE